MQKFTLISTIESIYKSGGNIQYLAGLDGSSANSVEDILISYDFQAGSYIRHTNANPEFNSRCTQGIADVLKGQGQSKSLLEAGVGEATTLVNVASKLNEGKARMSSHRYIRNIRDTIISLGYNLVEYLQFGISSNPLNPTALYVIEKDSNAACREQVSAFCPVTRSILVERTDHFFSSIGKLSYPITDGIPCFDSVKRYINYQNG